jgi:hypothetical protein
MESYVKEIVQEWEGHGARVEPEDDDRATSIVPLPRLRAFLERTRNDPNTQFRTRVSDPLRKIEGFFREQLIVPILPLGEESDIESVERTEYASGGG